MRTFRSDSKMSNLTAYYDKSINDLINLSFTVGHGPTRGKGTKNIAASQGFKMAKRRG